ncbi:MAG: hypothetical protein PHV03_09315 [Desulfitobacteriaceae bacterium]|nr:hypothetical protein [Desulfitobacteriaceae bacterium]
MKMTAPKINEKGQPFQRLEERVFARYISDIICGQAELSQITKEVLPELVGEAKLIRYALNNIALALGKIGNLLQVLPATPDTSTIKNKATIINMPVTDDVEVVLAVRDALFQASVDLEDKLPEPKLIVSPDLQSEDLEALLRKHSSVDANNNQRKIIGSEKASLEYTQSKLDTENASKILKGSPREHYIKNNYPPEIYTKVASLFVMCEEKQEELGRPITKYMEMRQHLPRLPYYLYGGHRIWHGFSEFKVAFDAWACC